MSYIFAECENNLFGIRKRYSELSLAVGGKIISQSVTGGGLMSLPLSFYITTYIRLDDSSNKNSLRVLDVGHWGIMALVWLAIFSTFVMCLA